MNTIKINTFDLDLYYAGQITAGYGHKKITVELCFEGEYKKFHAVTNNMYDFDSAENLEDHEEKQMAYYNLIANQIEDQIIEWLEEINQ